MLDAEVERHRQARDAQARSSFKKAFVIAICLGLVGTAIGLLLSSDRSKTTPRPLEMDNEASIPKAPIDMPGLAFLSPKTDSIIAIQLRAFLDSLPPGAERDPKTALLQLGIPEPFLNGIERISGLRLQEIDQIVLGMKLNGGTIDSQIVLVIHPRRPVHEDELAQKIKAARAEKDKDDYQLRIYLATAQQFPGRYFLWYVDSRCLVFALNRAVFRDIPGGGFWGRAHLLQQLRERITTLLTPDTYCWATLESDQWDAVANALLLFTKRGELIEQLAEPLSALNTITLGVRTDNGVNLTAWLETKSERSAEDFRSWLTDRFKESNGKISVGGPGNRVMVRGPANAAEIGAAIQLALPATGRK